MTAPAAFNLTRLRLANAELVGQRNALRDALRALLNPPAGYEDTVRQAALAALAKVDAQAPPPAPGRVQR